MARKSVALIGPGNGPEVRVACVPARIQVRGLGQEEFALVVQKLSPGEDIVLPVTADGIFHLIKCAYARVVYEGKNKRFIACVLMGG